ncbi:MAG TPA: hypothetical protein VIT45_03800 [Allosphingosinicella sp.]
MRALPLLVPILALAACSQESRQQSSSDLQTYNADESPAMDAQMPPSPPEAVRSAERTVAPGIGVTAAPGVAFNYRYGFSLPAEQVSGVQEKHAQLCEKIGIAQCRITGMLYRRVNEEDIEAMLAFKLDPAIARQFGKDGIAAVEAAEGMLVEAQVSGEDAGAAIAAATRGQAQLEEELRKVEADLARTGLRSAERAELQIRAGQLRDQIRATQAGKRDKEESLARTPVVFRYGAGDYAPGFEDNAPIATAFDRAGDNLVAGLAALVVILITLAPWLLIALLVWIGWRRVGRRWVRRDELSVTASADGDGAQA